MSDFPGQEHPWLAYGDVLHPIFSRAAFNPIMSQPVSIPGFALTHVQHLALGLVEPPDIPEVLQLDVVCNIHRYAWVSIHVSASLDSVFPCTFQSAALVFELYFYCPFL